MLDVRLTRKKTLDEHMPEILHILELARQGMVPVCGFISPGERELQRLLRLDPYARWIKTVPYGLPPRFDPSVEDSRFLAAGRQLYLSSFDNNVPQTPINYDNCHLMNDRNAAMCTRARVHKVV